MKAIIVIPTYNERGNIQELITAIRALTLELPTDILVVDSASPDGTASVVRDLMKTDQGLHLIEQKAKLGLGKAYLEGMQWALTQNYDALITMDADLSHDPGHLNQLLTGIKSHDLVIGSRYTKGGGLKNWPLARRFLSRFANWYATTITGLPFNDLTSGFQCFRTKLLRRILDHQIQTEGYAFLIELKFYATMEHATIQETPIVFCDRTKGESKISKKVMFESMRFVIKLAFRRGSLPKRTA